jgi:hypothetical protein
MLSGTPCLVGHHAAWDPLRHGTLPSQFGERREQCVRRIVSGTAPISSAGTGLSGNGTSSANAESSASALAEPPCASRTARSGTPASMKTSCVRACARASVREFVCVSIERASVRVHARKRAHLCFELVCARARARHRDDRKSTQAGRRGAWRSRSCRYTRKARTVPTNLQHDATYAMMWRG